MSTDTKEPKADEVKAAAPAPAKKAEPKRKMLTPAERVAKLEADLAEAKAKAEAKDKKAKDEAIEKRAKLLAKVDELSEQIIELDKAIGDKPVAAAKA